jgi:PAS domain S-box-containing protein
MATKKKSKAKAKDATFAELVQPRRIATPSPPEVSPSGEIRRTSAPRSSESLIRLRQLETVLRNTKDDLHATIGELECTNETLRLANDELEASKESLQSLNEDLQAKVSELEEANDDLANLFNCTDVATVFLDTQLRLKRYTPAVRELFPLIPSDLNRHFGDIKPSFADPDLLADAAQVMRDLILREKEVCTTEGRWWSRRIVPYRTRRNHIDGVVMTLVDITTRKRAAEGAAHLAAIVESSADAIFSKDLDGIIRTWNHGAERLYGYTQVEIVGQSVRLLVPDDRTDEFAMILARLRHGEHVALETERVRKDRQRIQVALTISPLRDCGGRLVSASVIARDISEHLRDQKALRDREACLQAILNTATDAIITIDPSGIIQSVNPAAEQMFGYNAAEMLGRNVKMLMPAPYRDEHDRYLARYQRTGDKHIVGIGQEVEARRKDGSVFAVDLAVSEVNQGKLFTGILRDISRRKLLEREVLEAATLEQRRIGQEMHDTVGQELTALGLLADSLRGALTEKSPVHAQFASKITQGVYHVLGQVRAISRGLICVEVDAEGLMAALAELAAETTALNAAACRFECNEPVRVADNQIATQMYCIAREAVTNALKHAQARHITIRLTENEQTVTLRVQDDGIGLSVSPLAGKGVGLEIMHYRTGLIHAHLSIGTGETGGTVVTCTHNKDARHAPKEARRDEQANLSRADCR